MSAGWDLPQTILYWGELANVPSLACSLSQFSEAPEILSVFLDASCNVLLMLKDSGEVFPLKINQCGSY